MKEFMQDFARFALMRSTVLRALKVAMVITPILTVVNHYDALVRLEFGGHFFAKVVMTFTVPYIVSTFS